MELENNIEGYNLFKYSDVLSEESKIESYVSEFFEYIVENDVSNVYVCSGDYMMMDSNNHKVIMSDKKLSIEQTKWFAKKITESDQILGMIYEGKSPDRAADVRIRGKRARFRINISRVFHMENDGMQITIRKIDFEPPDLDFIGIDKDSDIYKAFFSEQGLSLVTGPTGSGKSTTLASMLKHYSLDDNHAITVTFEEPIEYVHDEVNKKSKTSRIYQTEVPTGIKTFELALSKALRRQPDIIMLGELRDTPTISAAIEAGLTGHLVLSTTHTNGVPATIKRLVTNFPTNERDSRQVDIIEQLNIILAQRLLRTVDGKKIAVREYLIFDEDVKTRLQSANPLHLNIETRKIMLERNNGMLFEAEKLLNKGIIDKKEYSKIASIYKDEYSKSQK